jgi:magnesium-transporting ATPase (P-type)
MSKPDFNLEEVDKIWPRLRVMARCQPEHKLCLVTAMMESDLHKQKSEVKKLGADHVKIFWDGQIVAVTGDGTNDAPSLKKADVGFAMGIAGTKVSQGACDIVILDDNFASTVIAIKWGRNVYDSVAKFLQFQLTVNIVAIIVASLGAIVYQQSPLGAIQMLWVNLVMDSLGSLALATEPPTDKLLERKPYGQNQSMLSYNMWCNMLGQAIYQLAVMLYIMFQGEHLLYDETSTDIATKPVAGQPGKFVPAGHLVVGRAAGCEYTQHYTALFNTFVMMTLFNQVSARKLLNQWNIFDGICNNPVFIIIIFMELAGQIGFIEGLKKGGGCFKDGLTLRQWGICMIFGLGGWFWQIVVNFYVYLYPPKEDDHKDDDDDETPTKACWDCFTSTNPGVNLSVRTASNSQVMSSMSR